MGPVVIGQCTMTLNKKKGRFELYIRKKFFMVRVVKDWKRLLRELVDNQSLETFKVRFDDALGSLI